MEIQLKQDELKAALRNYIVNMGIIRPVEDITFVQTRKNGHSVEAVVQIAEPEADVDQVTATEPPIVPQNEGLMASPATETEQASPADPAADTGPAEPVASSQGPEPAAEDKQSLFS